jgi:hypothetical protein
MLVDDDDDNNNNGINRNTIVAVQDQALNTNCLKGKILKEETECK